MKRIGLIFLLIIVVFVLFLVRSHHTAIVHAQVFTTLPSGIQYVPNQVIVRYKQNKTPEDISLAATQRQNRAANFFGRLRNAAENSVLILQGQQTPEESITDIEQTKSRSGVVAGNTVFENTRSSSAAKQYLDGFYVYKTDGKKPLERVMQELSSLPEVEAVEPNTIFQANAGPNDPYYSQMWDLKKMEIEKAWEIGQGNDSVVVADVDTGINYAHPDFAGRTIIKGKDFSTGDCSDLQGNYSPPKSRDDDPMDDNGHGTHVAGTIGAVVNNGIGIAGINQHVSLMAVKTLASVGCGSTQDIADGIRYAADNGAKIINMSLGENIPCSQSTLFASTINYAKSKNVIVVVAAGNDAQNAGNFTPASCPGVITVGATGPNDTIASYSNYGSVVDIAAPGGQTPCSLTTSCILSTVLSNNYAWYAGTSMASPHVAGVIALMLGVKPDLTPDQVETFIKNPANADPVVNLPLTKSLGAGRLNAYKLLFAVSGGTAPTATPTVPANVTPTVTLTPSPSITGQPSSTPSVTPPVSITPSLTPVVSQTISPSVSPTPSIIPSPTFIADGCPAECAAGVPPRIRGNANCDAFINELDYGLWKTQWQIYQGGTSIPKASRTANFYCQTSDSSSQRVGMKDFEIWRQNASLPVVTPPPAPTPTTNIPTATPTSSIPTRTPTPTLIPLSPTPMFNPAFKTAIEFPTKLQDPAYIRMIDSPTLRSRPTMTIEGFYKFITMPRDNFLSKQTLITRHNDQLVKVIYWLYLGSNRRLVFAACQNFKEDVCEKGTMYSGSTVFELNRWYHIAMVRDTSGTTPNLRVFVNGKQDILVHPVFPVEETSVDYSLLFGAFCSRVCEFAVISGWKYEVYGQTEGVIDEVRISSIARYTSDFTPPTGSFTPDGITLGLWHFDEGSGTVVKDSSGNGNDGTVVGNARYVNH